MREIYKANFCAIYLYYRKFGELSYNIKKVKVAYESTTSTIIHVPI